MTRNCDLFHVVVSAVKVTGKNMSVNRLSSEQSLGLLEGEGDWGTTDQCTIVYSV